LGERESARKTSYNTVETVSTKRLKFGHAVCQIDRTGGGSGYCVRGGLQLSLEKIVMESLLNGLIGKTIDVSCGRTAVLRGEVMEINDGVLYLKDEDDKKAYVSIAKIATVCEVNDAHSRPGFVSR
jgi:hypothetical protein